MNLCYDMNNKIEKIGEMLFMKLLIIIFIILPAIEIALFILTGQAIGVLPTIGLMILSGILGAYLVKRQGLAVLRQFQVQLQAGEPPGIPLLHGLCVLLGGLFLISPGFLTDFIGLLLLIPFIRNWFIPYILKWIRNKMDRGDFIFIGRYY